MYDKNTPRKMIIQKSKLYSKNDLKINSYKGIADYFHSHGLKKLFEFLMENAHKLIIDEKTFCFIFRHIKPHIVKFFHPLPNIAVSKDLEPIKVFTKLLLSANITFESFLLYFSEYEIYKTFENLYSTDEDIVSISMFLIESIYRRYQVAWPILQEIFANELLYFISNPLVGYKQIEFILKLQKTMIINNNYGDDIEEYYEQFILPSILFMPFASMDVVSLVLEVFCTHITKCQKITLKSLWKSYYRIDSNEQIKIISMLSVITHSYFIKEYNGSIDMEIAEILKLSFQSENYLVVDTALNLLSDSAVKRFIEVYIKSILPIIFDSLYKLSKSFWRSDQKCKAIQAIGNIFNTNIDLFEECLISYNKKRYYKACDDQILDNEKFVNEKIKELISHSKNKQ